MRKSKFCGLKRKYRLLVQCQTRNALTKSYCTWCLPGVLACPKTSVSEQCLCCPHLLDFHCSPPLPSVIPIPQPAAVHMEMLPSSGHRGLTAAPAGLTQFWLTSPGKPRAWGPSAAQNQHPNLQVTFSTAFKAVIPQTQSQMPNAGAFRWEPPKPGSDGVRAPGEFGQHPQHRVGSLGSLALLFRARSWTQWPVGPFQLRGFHHSEVHFYWIILLKNSRKPPYFQLHMS